LYEKSHILLRRPPRSRQYVRKTTHLALPTTPTAALCGKNHTYRCADHPIWGNMCEKSYISLRRPSEPRHYARKIAQIVLLLATPTAAICDEKPLISLHQPPRLQRYVQKTIQITVAVAKTPIDEADTPPTKRRTANRSAGDGTTPAGRTPALTRFAVVCFSTFSPRCRAWARTGC